MAKAGTRRSAHVSPSSFFELTARPTDAVTSSQLGRLLLAIGVFLVCFLIDDVMSGVAMYRFPKGAGWNTTTNSGSDPSWGVPVLPDLGYDLLPYNTLHMCEPASLPTSALLLFLSATGVFLILFNKAQGVQIATRVFLCDAVLLTLRAFTVSTTSLNNPNPRCATCESPTGECPTTLAAAVIYTLQRFPFFSCGDLIFSGHTGHWLLGAFCWLSYYDGRSKGLVRILVVCIALSGMASLISCRYHYTDDVILALFMCTFTWYVYHVLTYVVVGAVGPSGADEGEWNELVNVGEGEEDEERSDGGRSNNEAGSASARVRSTLGIVPALVYWIERPFMRGGDPPMP
eukprot:TRINITY_DN1147_c0_g1_i1.p1 TRINITY_DN1147_c0_g1~~TRINITY_DN1147_c0_g1_i1.p1  ORF type:complete len:345 (-),score=41.76 TRINITY_DN1147_c0_g1_i1:28-1062(-)